MGTGPARSLFLVAAGAVSAGIGLGLGSLGSQTEVNELAPPERRGEVTAAYVTCIHTGVAVATISAGLLSDAFSLFVVVAIALVATLLTYAWHLARPQALRAYEPRPSSRRASAAFPRRRTSRASRGRLTSPSRSRRRT